MLGYAPFLGQIKLVPHAGFRSDNIRGDHQAPFLGQLQTFDDFIKWLCSEISYSAGQSPLVTHPLGWEQDILAKVEKSGYPLRDIDLAMEQKKCKREDADALGIMDDWGIIKTYIGRPRDFRAYEDEPRTYGQLEEVGAYYKNLSDPSFPGYIPGFGDQAEENYRSISARLLEITSSLSSDLGQTSRRIDPNTPLENPQTYPSPDKMSTVPIWKWALAGGAVIGLVWIFRKKLGILNF